MEERPTADGDDDRQARATNSWLRYSHLGIQFCVTFLLFVGAGWWLDPRLGTGPWLTIAGSLVGMSAATYLLIRSVNRSSD